jgi:type I restriction enzyme, S subunit
VNEWRDTTLGEVVQLQRGFDLTEKQAEAGPYPVISSGGVSYYTATPKLQGPGVVTGRKGVLGKVHFSAGPYWPHDTTLWVKDFRENHPRFIYYWLQTLPLAALDVGAANPTLNRNHAHLLKVRVPSPVVQIRIAAILGALDDLIANNLRRIWLLEQMAQAIYREWFVYFRYPGHEDDELADSPIGPIPESWEALPVSDAIEINPDVRASKGSEVPFVAMGDLQPGLMGVEPGATRQFGTGGSKFRRHDTLFARITPSVEHGKTGFVQFLNDDEAGMGSTEFLVLRGKRLSPYSTYLLARRDDLRKHAIGSMFGASGRQRVNNACFDTFTLAVPPVTLEQRFATYVAPAFGSVEVLGQERMRLERLRDVLLPKLVTGAVDVSQIDLDALLEELAA